MRQVLGALFYVYLVVTGTHPHAEEKRRAAAGGIQNQRLPQQRHIHFFLEHVKVRVGANHHGVVWRSFDERLEHRTPGPMSVGLCRFIVLRRGRTIRRKFEIGGEGPTKGEREGLVKRRVFDGRQLGEVVVALLTRSARHRAIAESPGFFVRARVRQIAWRRLGLRHCEQEQGNKSRGDCGRSFRWHRGHFACASLSQNPRPILHILHRFLAKLGVSGRLLQEIVGIASSCIRSLRKSSHSTMPTAICFTNRSSMVRAPTSGPPRRDQERRGGGGLNGQERWRPRNGVG